MPISFKGQSVDKDGTLKFRLEVLNEMGRVVSEQQVEVAAPQVSISGIKALLEVALAKDPVALLQQAVDELNRR